MRARTMDYLHVCTLGFVLVAAAPVVAGDYVSESRTIAATSQPTTTSTQRFTFILTAGNRLPVARVVRPLQQQHLQRRSVYDDQHGAGNLVRFCHERERRLDHATRACARGRETRTARGCQR